MRVIKSTIVLITFFVCLIVQAQEWAYAGNPDISFYYAKDLAFTGNRGVARDTLHRILSKYPEYTDVRNLLAKTLSWDGDYAEARKEFNKITTKEKNNKEVWVAAINNEIYGKEYHIALGLTNKALKFINEDSDLLELKAKITEKITGRVANYSQIRKHYNKITSEERLNKKAWIAAIKNEIHAKEYYIALGLSNKALSYLKGDEDLEVMKDYATLKLKRVNSHKEIESPINNYSTEAETTPNNNEVKVTHAFDVFDKVYNTMIYSSIEYKRKTKYGSIIPRINYSNRFQTHGVQYEIDLYPKLSKSLYAYVNYGHSNASIFPKHRVGGELYANLPKGIEASAGFRYLDFSTTNAVIYTGSLGLYSGNYYFSLRPYISPTSFGNTGLSGNVLVRKYLKDANNYLGFRAGMGFSPELKQLLGGNELIAETLLYVESQQLQLEYQFTGFIPTNSYKANLGLTRQELIFDSNNYVWSISAGITAQVKF